MYYLFFQKDTDIQTMFEKLIKYNSESIMFHSIKYNTVLQNCIRIEFFNYFICKKRLNEILENIGYNDNYQIIEIKAYGPFLLI